MIRFRKKPGVPDATASGGYLCPTCGHYDPPLDGPLFVALLRRLANQRSIQLEVGQRLTRR